MSFEVFSPIWSHVNEKEKTRKKVKKYKLLEKKQTKKWSGHMVKRYISTIFSINLLDGF